MSRQKRKTISKRTRFEVFKRDKFACQYCGRSAPDVLLEVDHIDPASHGGADDLMNYVTACKECNAGKSDKALTDDSAIKRRKMQLDDMQARREQLEAMLEWQRQLIQLDDVAVDGLAAQWQELCGYGLNEVGLTQLRALVRKFGVNNISEAIRVAVGQYVKYDEANQPTLESVITAFQKVGGICVVRNRIAEKPYMKDLYYIRGILKNRLSYLNPAVMGYMEAAIKRGATAAQIKDAACTSTSWSVFKNTIEALPGEVRNG